MCGIFAFFLKRPLNNNDLDIGRSALGKMVFRGPDYTGEWFNEQSGIFIGHNRLAIIDTTPEGNQPMLHDRVLLAVNGEIYNFEELRAELKEYNYIFSSNSDSEVLLRGWQTWDEGVLDRLDGMFASVYYDQDTKTTKVAVDHFGEKQLYWYESDEGIYLSSEIGVLADLFNPEKAMSGEKLTSFLSLGYIPAPGTGYKNIFKMTPASVITIKNGSIESKKHYWHPPVFEESLREPIRPLREDQLDDLHHAILASTKKRMVSDVPMCLFLSSGVDSSLVAAMCYHDLGVKLKCLTVSFPNGMVADEAPRAEAIASYLGLDHDIVISNDEPHTANMKEVLSLLGQPNDNITVISVFAIAKAAINNGYKVALTGMGGDEVFFGYQKHSTFYKLRHLYNSPEILRAVINFISGSLYRISGYEKFFKLSAMIGLKDHERYLGIKNYPAISWLRKLPEFREWSENKFSDNARPIELCVPYLDLTEIMPNSQLPALDVGSMRASLELRTPFLNRKVLETVALHNPYQFLAYGQKEVLRRLLARYLPRDLIDQPKRGFIFPQDRFLNNLPNQLPRLPGLDDDLVNEAWNYKHKAPNWTRIAIRLAIAESFMGV